MGKQLVTSISLIIVGLQVSRAVRERKEAEAAHARMKRMVPDKEQFLKQLKESRHRKYLVSTRRSVRGQSCSHALPSSERGVKRGNKKRPLYHEFVSET